MPEISRIDPKEFQAFGYLQEVNRQFLHPLGLALEVIVDEETGSVSIGGVWDCRDDPVGLIFDEGEIDPGGVIRVQAAWQEKAKTRARELGYVVQPVVMTPLSECTSIQLQECIACHALCGPKHPGYYVRLMNGSTEVGHGWMCRECKLGMRRIDGAERPDAGDVDAVAAG